MKKANPMLLLGIIFGLLGLVFAVLGVVFLSLNPELLPELFTAEVWLGDDTPDRLALPMVGLVFTVVGLAFVNAAVVLLLLNGRKQRLQEELERFGTRVQGIVTDIPVDRTYRVNGRSPLRIIAQAEHPYTRQTVTIKGPHVWETSLSVGDPVEVLFDPSDEKKSMVVMPEV